MSLLLVKESGCVGLDDLHFQLYVMCKATHTDVETQWCAFNLTLISSLSFLVST